MFRIVFSLLLAMAGAASADTTMTRLLENERRAINALPEARLASFLTRPTLEVEYSAKWLAG